MSPTNRNVWQGPASPQAEPDSARLEQMWIDMCTARDSGNLATARAIGLDLLTMVPETSEEDSVTFPLVFGCLATIEWLDGNPEAVNLIPDRIALYDDASPVAAHLAVNQVALLSNVAEIADAAKATLSATVRVAAAAQQHGPTVLQILADAVRVGERTLGMLTGHDAEALRDLRSAAQMAEDTLEALGTDPNGLLLEISRWSARVLDQQEQYVAAIGYHEQHVLCNVYNFGDDSLEVADACHELGLSCDQAGDFRRASRWYRTAYRIYEDELGTLDPRTRLMRANLAEMARMQGNFTYAEQELRGQIDIETRLDLPPNERDFLVPLHLAMILTPREELDEARTLLDSAMELAASVHGPESRQCGRVYIATAQTFMQGEDYPTAIDHYTRAITLLSTDPSQWRAVEDATFECGLCELHTTDTPQVQAHELLNRLHSYEERLGNIEDPTIGTYRLQLADHMMRLKLYDDLSRELPRIEDDVYQDLLTSFHFGPESTRFSFVQYQELLKFNIHQLMQDPSSAEAVEATYERIRSVRGFETRLARWRSVWAGTQGFRDERADIDRAQRTVTQLKLKLLQDPTNAPLHGDLIRAQRTLAQAQQQYSEAFSEMADEFTQDDGPSKTSLPDATAAVTYIVSPELDGRVPHLGAFVEQSGNVSVQFVDLGEAAPITSLVTQFRDEIRVQSIAPFATRSWRRSSLALWRLLIEPLTTHLASATNLWILPEAELSQVPFGLLAGPTGTLLLDEFLISYRFALTESNTPTSPPTPAAVVGSPAYTTGPEQAQRPDFDDQVQQSRFLSTFRNANRFLPLPATRDECDDIGRQLGVTPLLDDRATDTVLLALHRPICLHVATHGFYLPRTEPAAESTFGDVLTRRQSLEDPLERVGLAFAGANDYLGGQSLPSGQGDGLAYGSEVAAMDLTGTRLVTLSACQTGLGDVSSGDGTLGLQRAFITAGAASVVCSLWEVPDEATKELFLEFYRNVVAGQTVGNALRLAARATAASYPNRPMYWAGFVLYGDDTVIDLSMATANSADLDQSVANPAGVADEVGLTYPITDANQILEEAVRESAEGRVDESTALFDTVVDDERLPDSFRRRARIDRARHLLAHGNYQAARTDYSAIARDEDATPGIRTEAKFGVALTYSQDQSWAEGALGYTDYLATTTLDDNERARGLVNRGYCYFASDDIPAAFRDFDLVAQNENMPADQRGMALLGRLRCHLTADDDDEALADANSVIELIGSTPDVLAGAYMERAAIRAGMGMTNWQDDLHSGLRVEGTSEPRRQQILALLDLE